MMVIFLVGLVSMILMRTLRKDYARYSKDEDIDDMVSFEFFMYIETCFLFEKVFTHNCCLLLFKFSDGPSRV